MNKKLAVLLFAIGVGAASATVSAKPAGCIQYCVAAYKACVAAGVSDECAQDMYDCELDC